MADWFAPGPFLEIWRRISSPHPVILMGEEPALHKQLCFKQAVHAHYVDPGSNFLGYEGIGSERTCPSSVLMAFAHWQRYLFLESLPTSEQREFLFGMNNTGTAVVTAGQTSSSSDGAEAAGGAEAAQEPAATKPLKPALEHRRLNVVWLSRYWFGKSMLAGGGLTGWQQQRQPTHEHEIAVVRALQEAVLHWNSEACAPAVFGWWQKPQATGPQRNCKATNVSFDFHVSDTVLVCNAPATNHALMYYVATMMSLHAMKAMLTVHQLLRALLSQSSSSSTAAAT